MEKEFTGDVEPGLILESSRCLPTQPRLPTVHIHTLPKNHYVVGEREPKVIMRFGFKGNRIQSPLRFVGPTVIYNFSYAPRGQFIYLDPLSKTGITTIEFNQIPPSEVREVKVLPYTPHTVIGLGDVNLCDYLVFSSPPLRYMPTLQTPDCLALQRKLERRYKSPDNFGRK